MTSGIGSTIASSYTAAMKPRSTSAGEGAQAGMVEKSKYAASGATLKKNYSTKGSFSGYETRDLRFLSDFGMGRGDTSLSAISVQRNRLSRQIDGIIKSAEITLGKTDKLSITIDKDDQIVVSGIANERKLKALEKELNADPALAKSLKRYSALGQMNIDRAREKTADEAGAKTAPGAYTNKALRAYLVDQYIQEETGVSLADLSVIENEDGTVAIQGGEEGALNGILNGDQVMADTIRNILDNGEHKIGFSATFSFANGMLSDPGASSAARDKVNGIRRILMEGYKDPNTGMPKDSLIKKKFDELMALDKKQKLNPALEKALTRGFSITVAKDGAFEISGIEGLAEHEKSMLQNLVEEAIGIWKGLKEDVFYTGGMESFQDVAETMLQEHQFEHGDTEEAAHDVAINFMSGGSTMIEIVSPQGDMQQDAENRAVAPLLGDALRSMLEVKDIDTTGMKLEMDQSGRITVSGAHRSQVMLAQKMIDDFVSEMRGEIRGDRRNLGTGKDAAEHEKEVKRGTNEEEEENDNSPVIRSDTRPLSLVMFSGRPLPSGQTGADLTIGARQTSNTLPSWLDAHRAGEDNPDSAQALYRRMRRGMYFHDRSIKAKYTL